MLNDILLITDVPLGDSFPILPKKIQINITNLYAGVSVLFDIYRKDEELSENERYIFNKAMNILHEKMDGEALHDIMGEDAATYSISAESMLVYAKKIIENNM